MFSFPFVQQMLNFKGSADAMTNSLLQFIISLAHCPGQLGEDLSTYPLNNWQLI